MGLKLANNAISYLASGIAAGDTSIALKAGDGSKFPTLAAGDYHPATISKADGTFEIVKVTARTSDTLTVTRAQEGTTAMAFAANCLIELRLTAQAIADIKVASYKLPILLRAGASTVVQILGSTVPVTNRAGGVVNVALSS